MSVLDEVLLEEHLRLEKMKNRVQKEYLMLPNGYISQKKINGSIYYYLQFREGNKIVSRYIKSANVEDIRELISRRKILKESLKNIDIEMKKIERVLK